MMSFAEPRKWMARIENAKGFCQQTSERWNQQRLICQLIRLMSGPRWDHNKGIANGLNMCVVMLAHRNSAMSGPIRNSLSYNLFLNPRFSFVFRSSPFESGYHEPFIRTTIIKSFFMGHFGHNQMGPFSVVFQDSRGCPGFRPRESILQGVERSSVPIDLRRDTIGHDMKINRKNLLARRVVSWVDLRSRPKRPNQLSLLIS